MRRPVQAQKVCGRKIPRISQRCDADRSLVGKLFSQPSRKAAIAPLWPVPETDTGGWGENPKAGGRSIGKALDTMTPLLREKGCLREQAAENRPKQLFSKNTGLC